MVVLDEYTQSILIISQNTTGMTNLMITMHGPLNVKCLGGLRNAKKELS